MALIKSVRGFTPQLGSECFLAETAVILGEVFIGNHCTIWYNAVVRGDVNRITIGDRTNIQDGVVIHGTYQKNSTILGSDVSIGHNAIVHGCTIEDRVLIGMGAIVMDTAVIETGSMVAAGAVVLQGTKVSAGMLYAGVPAKPIRKIDQELLEMIDRTAKNYPIYASWFKESQK